MNTQALNSLAELICRAQGQDRTPMGIAFAIDAAGRHMSPETAAELEALRAEVAALRAERHVTNEALDDAVQALRATEVRGELGTLPAWLYQRFLPGGIAWEYLDAETREYWEHQARAVQRAVQRGGFKDPTLRAEDDVTPQVQKLRSLLAVQREAVDGEHYAVVHHDYRKGRDLPEMGGAR